MKKSRLLGVVQTCSLLLLPLSAHAALVTFGSGTPLPPLGYTEAGMTISSVTSDDNVRILDWQSYTGDPSISNGEREILDNDGASYTFSLVSGGVFDLLSIDIENPVGTGLNWSATGSIDVVGSNGSLVNLSATSFGTQTFGSTFSGLTSFRIDWGEVSQVTFDNIEFQVIPIPAAAWLFGSGLIGLVGMARRKKA